jgi:hypothetical protein
MSAYNLTTPSRHLELDTLLVLVDTSTLTSNRYDEEIRHISQPHC